MKNVISIIFSLMLFQSCAQESISDGTADLTKKVENGLVTTPVYIVGDSTWTIEERMEHYRVPGVSIAVIQNGEVAWTKGYGVMDKESKLPVTEQTLFQAVSQPVAAYGALQLAEQNKIDLNEDINNYLKSWKVPDSEFTKDKKVTTKNLLNHAGGTNVHAFEGYALDEPKPTLIEILNGTPPAKSNPIILEREPEVSHWSTSGGGYLIVQQMMMDVEGRKYPEIMNDLVLKPLEMNHSTFNQPLTKQQNKMAATGYLTDGSMVKGKSHVYPEMAAQGLWTTAGDLAKFVINIQQFQRSINNEGKSQDMAALMLSPFVKENYGLGTYLYNRKDDIYFGQGLWNRGFYSNMAVHKDKGYGVVVLTNTTSPPFVFELIRSVALAYKWDNYTQVYEKMAIEQSLIDDIKGKYQADNRVEEIFQKGDQLFAKNILSVEAEELIRISDSTFAKRNTRRLMQFKKNNENGTVDLIYIDENDESILATLIKRNDSKKEPVEFLIEGDLENALQAYRVLIENDPAHPTVDEEYIDDLGEYFLSKDKTNMAQNIFKFNTMLYPERFQVYDRYANVCMQTGEIDLAILNYNKVLELNPQNNQAKERLKELRKSN